MQTDPSAPLTKSPWHALEQMPSLLALPVVWHNLLGTSFDLFKSAFLRARPDLPASLMPCPNGCATPLEIFMHGPEDIVAISHCESSLCTDLIISPTERIPLELSWTRLSRELASALSLQTNLRVLDIPRTRQIGSWSSVAIPVILCLPFSSTEFRSAIAEIIARFRGRLIVLAPTSRFLDALSREWLTKVGAELFALDTHLVLTERGTLQARRAPGELFAQFCPPASAPPDEDAARQAFALVKQLEPTPRMKLPSLLTVFRLYCIEEHSASQIAREAGCSKTTVIDRLNQIRQRTGVAPENLRRLSTHFAKLEDDLSDSRASHIHRRRLLYDEDEP